MEAISGAFFMVAGDGRGRSKRVNIRWPGLISKVVRAVQHDKTSLSFVDAPRCLNLLDNVGTCGMSMIP